MTGKQASDTDDKRRHGQTPAIVHLDVHTRRVLPRAQARESRTSTWTNPTRCHPAHHTRSRQKGHPWRTR